jgi:hypothetical protein
MVDPVKQWQQAARAAILGKYLARVLLRHAADRYCDLGDLGGMGRAVLVASSYRPRHTHVGVAGHVAGGPLPHAGTARVNDGCALVCGGLAVAGCGPVPCS